MGFLVAVIWGLTFVSIKTALSALSPMTLALARFVMASLILPLVALVLKQKLAVKWKDVPILAAAGFVGVTIYFYFENNGILRLSASEASLIIGTIPVVTILAERIFLRQRHVGRVYAGIVLSFVGVALIVAGSAGGSSSLPGYVFMVGAALAWVGYTFLTRPLAGRYGMLTVTFWQIFAGMIGCIPFAVAETAALGTNPLAMLVRAPLDVWLNVAYLGVFASALGYWLYVLSLETLGAGRSSVFINLIPVVSVIASYFILGDRLGTGQWAGGVVAVVGVYLATMPERKLG